MKTFKKMIALFMVLSMCAIFPMAASAAPVSDVHANNTVLEAEPLPLPLPDFEKPSSGIVTMGMSKSFICYAGQFAEPVLSDYYVTKGQTKLTITSMTWDRPACDITVGFFPSGSTGTQPYGVRFSGGYVSNTTITTSNIPTGTYWVYILNNGDVTVNGTINYSISG